MSVEPLELLAQIIVALIVFSVCMKSFFSKVLWVLEQRESKTTRLAQEADQEMEKYLELKDSYEKKVQTIHRKIQGEMKKELDEIVQREDQKYQKESAKINTEVDQKRESEIRDICAKEQQVLKGAEDLARDLTQKLARER